MSFLFQATSEVRQAWVNSRGNEKLGERLSVRQFPISLLRHQMDNRRVHCKSADPHYWMSDEDKRRAADKRKSFERQWSAEVSKRFVESYNYEYMKMSLSVPILLILCALR